MVFSSNVFLLIFLPLVLIVYYLLPARLRNLGLLIASLLFYAWGEPIYIFIMLFSTVFDYSNGILIERFEDKPRAKRLILALSIVVNLGMLCFFKYTDFAIEAVNSITGLGISTLNLALPIGISFYTFQTLSYTIDVYRGTVKAQHNLIAFGMYVSMFPQLIAGPIVRYADIEKQLLNRKLKADEIANGIFRFVIGLAKKVLIANQVGAVWEEISSIGNVPTLTAWIGATAFMLQIYFDFSGYSDMAIGLGKMLGFELLENFNYPYESKSVTEFWRKWHISLGTWFREYLYIPLGGNRKGTPRQILNLFVVWFLTGLWHGAGWNFIIWGIYFFVILVLEKLVLKNLLEKLPSVVGHIYTLLVVLFSWVIFACDNMELFGNYVRSLFGFNGFMNDMSLYYLYTNAIILIIGAVLSTSLLKRLLSKLSSFGIKATITIILYAVCIMFVATESYNPFLYFRF